MSNRRCGIISVINIPIKHQTFKNMQTSEEAWKVYPPLTSASIEVIEKINVWANFNGTSARWKSINLKGALMNWEEF